MDFAIHFNNPAALLLILLAVPVAWHGWRRLTGQATVRRSIVIGVRVVVITLLAMALAEPKWMERGEGLSVVALIDRSRSISPELELQAIEYLQQAVESSEARRPEDRIAVINIGAEARVERMPDRAAMIEAIAPIVNREATNLAHAMRMGMAIAPRDTATRFVMVSDGNENIDSVMAVADIARANHIPVDALVLSYDYDREVIFDRLQVQPQARQGQNVTVNMILRAQRPMSGRIVLSQEETPIDLDLESDEIGMRVQLEEGVNAFPVVLPMDVQGPQRLRAEFVPDDPRADAIAQNNRAESVVVVGGEGRVLLVRDQPEDSEALERALEEAQIEVEVVEPIHVHDDLIALSGYDAIILADVPAHAFPVTVHETLRLYVYEIGGGLIMLGGPESFGAGGWIDTELAKALPVRLDPPDQQQMPRGALVCIMHSSEIPQGNYWGEKCAERAILALSRFDMAGIIDFDWNQQGGGMGGCNWVYPLQTVGDKSAAIAAVRKMTMGDMPDFTPAMTMALNGLKNVSAGQKHVIIISDGDPQRPSSQLLNDFVANGITISTVIAGGHGSPADDQVMKWVAETTGGEFYKPRPNQMPEIFVKEAMIVRRSLIVEEENMPIAHRPTVRPGPFINRWQLPTLDGYILTASRPGHDPEIVSADRNDPIFAHWQYGVGRSIAFTSDATSRWSDAWLSWEGYQQFWEQSVRWAMRPAAPTDLLLRSRTEGDHTTLEVEALTEEGGFASFGRVQGIIISPGLEAKPISLQQVGPGKWRADIETPEQGTWVVNLSREDEDGTRRSVQAGISVPYSRELRDLRDNTALMSQLAERTGGRMLLADPTAVDLFAREDLPRPASLTDLWTLVAILASGVFLLDVATRRLAIDVGAVRKRFTAMLGRSASSAGASMGRLKQARGETRERFEERKRSAAGPTARDSAAPAEADVSAVRFEAAEGDRATAIDLEAPEADQDRRAAAASRSRRAMPPQEKPAAEDEGDYTSRLLKAKRRARGGNGESGGDATDEGRGGKPGPNGGGSHG